MAKLYTCLCVYLLSLVFTASAWAADWEVLDYYPQADPGSIVFTFGDDVLSINQTSVFRQGGSSGGLSTLHFAGIWGVVSRSADMYDPDPLARFVITGDGTGYVDWAAGAPHGYQAYLLLGHRFDGNGAAIYHRTYPPEYDVTGTLVLGERFGNGIYYRNVYNTFEVVNTPEPSAMLALIYGFAVVAGIVVRSRWQ